MASPDLIAKFIARWSKAEAAERANYQLFLSELCDVLDVPRPDPAGPDTELNAYVFERSVTFQHAGGKTSTGRIDLYKRDSFVLEAKQYAARQTESADLALGESSARKPKTVRGSEAWDRAMLEAHGQAERYARSLPLDEDPPPFLLVVDVGHVFELYADFSQKGKAYLPFPDARAHRIRLADLAHEEVRAKLRAIWLDPHSLDPAKIAAAVTREVAGHLAELAKSFEQHHDPATVAAFLSRCLFCMFAEDVELLPRESFTSLLESVKADPGAAVPLLQQLFEEMNVGKFSNILRQKILQFNGGLFAEATVLPLNGTQLGLLIRASRLQWRHVEPAIFGTLLERALNPAERHKLGAHYTPRAYVERLVLPTVVEPLREEWSAVRVAAVTLATRGNLKAAIKETRAFHHKLCAVRVLDPACGSGNFLYVTLEHLKRLEGEVLQLIEGFGENMRLDLGGETVDPHQFLGLEINPRAATIAELVLWIGYLQWHHRNRGATEWPEPVLRAFKNIECRDAVLAYDREEFAKDEHGKTRFIWDRKTTKLDAVTGRAVPDDKAVIPLKTYVNPRPAAWPQADYIIGNPPFMGARTIRPSLGDGYLTALRSVYTAVPENCDYVMYWWHKAADLVRLGSCRQFGLITTNSITQSFNRAVVEPALTDKPCLVLRFAIPDHPWVDSSDGAAVRIAMTVGVGSGERKGRLWELLREERGEEEGAIVSFSESRGIIEPNLTIGTDALEPSELISNRDLCCVGYQLTGTGFTLSLEESELLRKRDGKTSGSYVHPLLSARDITQEPRSLFAIDLSGLSETEARARLPAIFNWVLTRVKPERDQNPRASVKSKWWLYGESRNTFRPALVGQRRMVVAPLTSKHRLFVFTDSATVADSTTVMFAFEDSFNLGVLSSRIHVTFSLAAGGHLGVGNDPRYNKTRCFDPFPFPECTEKQKEKIRKLAEELDAHRKRAQQTHGLGLTDIYNVLEKIRAASAPVVAGGADPGPGSNPKQPGSATSATILTPKERAIHDAALVSTLRQLHDDLDRAVADAYGWPWPLSDAEILERVVALNAQRAAEEAGGQIRWLRPDYQKPLFAGAKQSDLGLEDTTDSKSVAAKKSAKPAKARKPAWPKTIPERAKAVENALAAAEHPLTAAALAKQFTRANEKDVLEILETLAALGRARPGDGKGTYVR